MSAQKHNEGDNFISDDPLLQLRQNMNLSEMRLFEIGLRGIAKRIKNGEIDSKKLPTIFVTQAQLETIFAEDTIDKEPNHHDSTDNLTQRIKKAFYCTFYRKDGEGRYLQTHVYTCMDYQVDEGLYMEFDAKMLPVLIELIAMLPFKLSSNDARFLRRNNRRGVSGTDRRHILKKVGRFLFRRRPFHQLLDF